MSLASIPISARAIADQARARRTKSPPATRRIIAKPDDKLEPEAR